MCVFSENSPWSDSGDPWEQPVQTLGSHPREYWLTPRSLLAYWQKVKPGNSKQCQHTVICSLSFKAFSEKQVTRKLCKDV